MWQRERERWTHTQSKVSSAGPCPSLYTNVSREPAITTSCKDLHQQKVEVRSQSWKLNHALWCECELVRLNPFCTPVWTLGVPSKMLMLHLWSFCVCLSTVNTLSRLKRLYQLAFQDQNFFKDLTKKIYYENLVSFVYKFEEHYLFNSLFFILYNICDNTKNRGVLI